MIWRYLRPERLHYEHEEDEEDEAGKGEIKYSENEDTTPPFPLLSSFSNIFLVSRFIYIDVHLVPQPTTMHAKSRNLNDALHLLQKQRHITIDELHLTLEGESTSGEDDTPEIDVDDVQTNIAIKLLELKRRYTDASFAGIHWLFAESNDDGWGLPKEFQLTYIVRVGKVRPRTLGGPIKRELEHPDEELEGVKEVLQSVLSQETLDLMLNEMGDTPGEGLTGEEVRSSLASEDEEVE